MQHQFVATIRQRPFFQSPYQAILRENATNFELVNDSAGLSDFSDFRTLNILFKMLDFTTLLGGLTGC